MKALNVKRSHQAQVRRRACGPHALTGLALPGVLNRLHRVGSRIEPRAEVKELVPDDGAPNATPPWFQERSSFGRLLCCAFQEIDASDASWL